MRYYSTRVYIGIHFYKLKRGAGMAHKPSYLSQPKIFVSLLIYYETGCFSKWHFNTLLQLQSLVWVLFFIITSSHRFLFCIIMAKTFYTHHYLVQLHEKYQWSTVKSLNNGHLGTWVSLRYSRHVLYSGVSSRSCAK